MKTTISRRDITRFCTAALCSAAFIPFRKVYGQTAPAQQFEVSTVKPSNAFSDSSSGISTGHGLLDARNVTLMRCIMGAYAIGPHQVVGGPDWVYSDRFDIVAKADQPIDDDEVFMAMLQGLLADRFKLTLHRETRIMRAFVLQVDKKGPKMEKAAGGDSDTNTSSSNTGRVKIDIKNTDMDSFAQILARKMDLPVVNNTELKGLFNFTLHWTLDTAAPSKHEAEDDVSLFTALQEQLGLRLRSAKAPVSVLVIDHVEKPSAN
jgi:uncharacterized protein (TIGR03435 family)